MLTALRTMGVFLAIITCPVALAKEAFTLMCSATEVHTEQTGFKFTEAKKPVTRLYTLRISKDVYGDETGEWYDWEAKNWFPISSITMNAYELLNMDDGQILVSINRNSGEWVENSFNQGKGTDFVHFLAHGTCKKVALKMPNHL